MVLKIKLGAIEEAIRRVIKKHHFDTHPNDAKILVTDASSDRIIEMLDEGRVKIGGGNAVNTDHLKIFVIAMPADVIKVRRELAAAGFTDDIIVGNLGEILHGIEDELRRIEEEPIGSRQSLAA